MEGRIRMAEEIEKLKNEIERLKARVDELYEIYRKMHQL